MAPRKVARIAGRGREGEPHGACGDCLRRLAEGLLVDRRAGCAVLDEDGSDRLQRRVIPAADSARPASASSIRGLKRRSAGRSSCRTRLRVKAFERLLVSSMGLRPASRQQSLRVLAREATGGGEPIADCSRTAVQALRTNLATCLRGLAGRCLE